MISHRVNIVQIKDILKTFELKGLIKPGEIKLMPVYRYIEIERTRLSSEDEAVLKAKFAKRYGTQLETKEVRVADENGVPKTILYLSFEKLNEAVFAYMALESFKLRPYFVKDTTYRKKPKCVALQ